MRSKWICLVMMGALVAVAGCGRRRGGGERSGGEPSGGGSGDDIVVVDAGGSGSGEGTFEDFTHATVSVDTSDSPFNVSVTDLTGNIGCALASSFSSSSGLPSSQVFVSFRNSSYRDCPEGTYAIDTERCATMPADEVWRGCARYRRFGTEGELEVSIAAVGGAVTVSRTASYQCTYELDLVFPGGVIFSETRAISYEDLEPGPWCISS